MKLEKINDNQIRCTLSSDDLKERHIKLSELCYGSDKARDLLSDVMQLAATECGFEGEDSPLVVEAIPMSPGSLVVLITKVDSPEELDTRFSRFTPFAGDDEADDVYQPPELFSNSKLEKIMSNDEALMQEVFKELKSIREDMEARESNPNAPIRRVRTIRVEGVYRSFEFESLDAAADFASTIAKEFTGKSTLFKDVKNKRYYLVLYMRGVDGDAFNRICNVGCEFGRVVKNDNLGYYKEFYKLIAKGDAVSRLVDIARV